MPTYLIDTNILLRTLIKENEVTFSACVRFLGKLKTNQAQAVLPGVVIDEVVWTLKSFYGLSKKDAIKAVESILRLNNLKIVDDYDYHHALKLWKEHKSKYIDCLIATLAQKENLIILSYDDDFDKLQVVRVEP